MRLAMRAAVGTGASARLGAPGGADRPNTTAHRHEPCSTIARRRPASIAAAVAVAAVQRRRSVAVAAAHNDNDKPPQPPSSSLSDLIAFESDVERSEGDANDEDNDDPTVRAQAIIGRATKVLEAARAALGAADAGGGGGGGGGASAAAASTASAAAAPFGGGPTTATPVVGPPVGSIAASGDLTRAVLHGALERAAKSANGGSGSGGRGASSSSSSASSATTTPSGGMPEWASGLLARDDEDVFLNTPPMFMGGSGADGDDAGGSSSGSGSGSGSGSSSGGGGGPIVSGGWPAAAAASASPPFSSSSGNSSSSGGGGLRLAPALGAALLSPAPVAFAEDPSSSSSLLDLPSQAVADAERARRTTELPLPLQSVVELTSAFRPPDRGGAGGGAPAEATATTSATSTSTSTSTAGRDLPDGSGVLADGTRYEKSSGVEYGANGYWRRWRTLRGTAMVPVAEDGGPLTTGSIAAAAAKAASGSSATTQRMARVEFEETWWEASDYAGLRVMGAEKRGRDAQGGQWRERWEERLFYASAQLDGVVERSAHKWARAPLPAGAPSDAAADEWEERWDEHYHASGRASKSADKWGKQGANVWHERWGEDYDGQGACVKWTDKWAERLLDSGKSEQWGDKWHEEFADGRGRKNGEVWSVGADGGRYQRWWGEEHYGGGSVRRHGHSTSGEAWDDTVQMDTYYNPIPHFGYQLAVEHSPQLMNVPLRPRTVVAQEGGGGGGGGGDDDDPFGPGLDAL